MVSGRVGVVPCRWDENSQCLGFNLGVSGVPCLSAQAEWNWNAGNLEPGLEPRDVSHLSLFSLVTPSSPTVS